MPASGQKHKFHSETEFQQICFMTPLEHHFRPFRENIIGYDLQHQFGAGLKPVLYADWAASGRLYKPIEDFIIGQLGPYVANTHTETTLTGTVMTKAYHDAHQIIKKHVNAGADDRLLFAGFGMTAVINKFQRIMGLRVPEQFTNCVKFKKNTKPLVIITHMEHHSNQTSWAECQVDLKIINRLENGLPDLDHLREILEENKERKTIIGSFTACSNVTGIFTPYYEMAEIIHQFGGYAFVDFSASAPYVKIDMHPANPNQALDAIFFSPHKFLGGPGSSGVVIFNRRLYSNQVPDQPGGGTVVWTNPWGGHHYFDEIEIREDGGTPGFLQAIRAALSIKLKDEMGIDFMMHREHELNKRLMEGLENIPNLIILEQQQKNRLGFISVYSPQIHHNLAVRLLNDRFGIQTRGGCSCAGTYGHVLLHISYHESKRITDKINLGDLTEKPGWVRISIHPTMTNAEIDTICEAMDQIIKNHNRWQTDYNFDSHRGEWMPKSDLDFSIALPDKFNVTANPGDSRPTPT